MDEITTPEDTRSAAQHATALHDAAEAAPDFGGMKKAARMVAAYAEQQAAEVEALRAELAELRQKIGA